MSIVDVDVLLQEVEAGMPCGPNLEYDPLFLELEQNALGKPEVQYGKTIVPAVPPEWKLVKKQAFELLGRARDLRVAMLLLRSLLALHAVPGFADGLRLIERLVEERWDSVHPQLDPDDDNDPTLRLNSLATLVDPASIIRDLKDTAFIQLPNLGPLSVRVLEIANGETTPPAGQAAIAPASIEAALRDVRPEAMLESAQAVGAAHDSVANLEALLARQVGAANAIDLGLLKRQLRRMRDLLAPHLPQTEEATDMADAPISDEAAAPAAATAAAAPAPISGEINSRADVVRMLDKILVYYQRNEPSSPVPMLIERAKRLAPKNFFEIMEELAPESVNQLKILRGPEAA
ncbi:type VI secretion system protein TssA [Massilia sp. G4R7]|uniref:Type VI secretion system protein TssA n=1 Tax=Massilia phyllostachyos TaxID=2898585 RepID=A0ABS8Q5V5_9BURK|nr:type VI secretion system protein TssA [Massilia phyllostachyos]MCD2517122.1 type VI secretion system protein TssA [Massilia phyllostachyos]